MTNRHGKNRSAKRRMGHKRPAPSDRLPEIDPMDHFHHDDGPVPGCVYCEALTPPPNVDRSHDWTHGG